MNVTSVKCKLCQYEWEPRINRLPKACPRCKRYDWNVQKRDERGAEESA